MNYQTTYIINQLTNLKLKQLINNIVLISNVTCYASSDFGFTEVP